ncbi:MAG: GspH/FimT family protein [Planctomycetes bacterium]|nr:GspH/FimT family protein [Planctomycetota bacterium]
MSVRPNRPTGRENQPGGPPARRTAGFSLPELLVVIVVLAVMATVGISRYAGSVVHHELHAAARRVQADLELARQRAIATGAGQTVQFTAGTGRYSLLGVADINRPGSTYAIDLAGSPYQVTIASANFDGAGASQITFDAYGKPVFAQVLAANVIPSVVLTAGGRTVTVALDPSSGKAHLP